MAEYIDREVAVKAFNNFDAGRADSPPCTLLTPEEFAEYLYDLPAADVAPVVHGRWDENGNCTNCGRRAPFWSISSCYYKSPYCQSCGAKMNIEDGGDSDEAD